MARVTSNSGSHVRRKRRRNAETWWILGAGVGAAILTPFVVDALVEAPREPPPAPVRAVVATAVQPVVAVPPPAPVVPRADLPPIKLSPPYEVADGITILTERARVRLAGLEGPGKEAACFDRDGNLWGCGLQARAALNNFIRTKDLVCRPTGERSGDA